MPRQPVIHYRRVFEFGFAPAALWESIERVDQFERWCPWLQEFRLEGETLQVGSVLQGVSFPPCPTACASE